MKCDGENSFSVSGKEINIPCIRIPGNLLFEFSGLSCLLENFMNQHFLTTPFCIHSLVQSGSKNVTRGKKNQHVNIWGKWNKSNPIAK